MAEVARRAGVSVSTVSHVVNRTRFVSPEKAKIVESTIALMGYQPNGLARSLKLASTNSVGLAISAISNPYFSDIICAVEAECARLGLMVFLFGYPGRPRMRTRSGSGLPSAAGRRRDSRPLGFRQSRDSYLADNNIPCVLIDRFVDGRFDQVGVENQSAMRMLIDHVVSFGHRRIGFVAGQPGPSRRRWSASRRSAQRWRPMASISCRRLYLVRKRHHGVAATSTNALLSLALPPTALVAGNNLATIGAVRAIREKGLVVPRDLSLVGFDDFEWADCFEPRLTLVAQPCVEIGRQAAALLSERIVRRSARPGRFVSKATLRVRESCARPA